MANAAFTDPLESLTKKLIDHSSGGRVRYVEAWELRSVLNELRAAREAVCDETTWLDREVWKHAMQYVDQKMKEARPEQSP